MTLTNTSKLLRQFDAVDIYPNIAVALRMVLSTPVTNCTGERSFSTLRRDPFMAEHLRAFGDKGSGNTSYLSKTTYEELIALMADKVKSTILKEVTEAKYFGFVLDSTPDISHVDQLTFVIRYVTNEGLPIERFLCFVPNVGGGGQKAEENGDSVLGLFEEFHLDILNCRGQSYDNSSNMSSGFWRSGTNNTTKSPNRVCAVISTLLEFNRVLCR
uniref:DUF4371 domain-containing protein n=1 Tax=Cacopsylla melanoneura TaxID=428564 RepID=A0A8D9ADI4_9HEMI